MNARLKKVRGSLRRSAAFCIAGCPAATMFVMAALLFVTGCTLKPGRSGVPPEVESVVQAVNDDIAAGNYEKLYNDADNEWRQDSTLEQTNAVFNTLKDKLGNSKSRQLQSAEENNSSGRLGHSFVLRYETRFERGEGMETFTLVERNGHWLLAKYLVNSTALE
jgi:Protein of unknown function (DUF4019)